MQIFDTQRHRRHHDRAAARICHHDPALQACAERLTDCLRDINRPFATVLELGSRHGLMQAHCRDILPDATWIAGDVSLAMLNQNPTTRRVVMDAEQLPFAEHSVDAVVSCMGLHWVNDLPGTLAQLRRILKPDGLLLASLPGPATLREWKQAALQAAEIHGGLPPMVSPFVDGHDAGALLQRAGFALPVVDQDMLTVDYADPLALCADLRGCGESNALLAQPKHCLGKGWFAALLDAYRQRASNPDGSVHTTLEIVTLTAWAPHASQQKPARRGSGTFSLQDALQEASPTASPQ